MTSKTKVLPSTSAVSDEETQFEELNMKQQEIVKKCGQLKVAIDNERNKGNKAMHAVTFRMKYTALRMDFNTNNAQLKNLNRDNVFGHRTYFAKNYFGNNASLTRQLKMQ